MEQAKYDVFISYSRDDYFDEYGVVISGNEVSKIKDALADAGITYWFDEEISSGHGIREEIATNIENSALFLFLSSANANKSDWIYKEIVYADKIKKYIIPVCIDATPYNNKVNFLIGNLKYIKYYTNPQKGLDDMLMDIKTYLDDLAKEEKRKEDEVQQKQLIYDIRTSVFKLNEDETKLDLERANLYAKTDKVIDIKQRESLKYEILESSPIRKKSQDEIKMLQEQVTELKTERDFLKQKHNPSTHKKNKWVHIVYWCIILILFFVICIRSFIEHNSEDNTREHDSEKNTRQIVDAIDEQKVSVADSILEFYVDNVKFNMVRIEGGTFKMGAQNSNSFGDNYDCEALSDENPVHIVTLDNYYMGETEVTQTLWKVVMGTTLIQKRIKNRYKKNKDDEGDDYPMSCVEWDECQEFINKLNLKTGKNFRLPTEAEWEYAARGGKKSQGYNYAGSKTIGEVAWYTENSGNMIHPVKGKMPNELGLYDMSGNVWEWCRDFKGKYDSSKQTNPTGFSYGRCVLRGGSWDCHSRGCRVSSRNDGDKYFWDSSIGFRLVLPQ